MVVEDFIPIHRHESFLDLLVHDENNSNKRKVAAAACRATRAKKKQEKDDLKSRNEKLEKEREIYLAQIAHLQTQVQMLREAGSVDLKLENELLVAEINKHQGFVQQLVKATHAIPSCTDEERYRYIRSGIDSAIGQILGLCFTSQMDPNWKTASMMAFSTKVQMKYQMLPLGTASWKDVRRANIRVDLPARHESLDTLERKFWNLWADPVYCEELMRRSYSSDTVTVGLEKLPHSFSTHDMEIFRYTEKSELTTKDGIFILTRKRMRLLDSQKEAVVICNASTHDKVEPVLPGVIRLKSFMMEGYILAPNDDGITTKVTAIISLPRETNGYSGFTPNDKDPIDESSMCMPELNRAFETLLSMLNKMD